MGAYGSRRHGGDGEPMGGGEASTPSVDYQAIANAAEAGAAAIKVPEGASSALRLQGEIASKLAEIVEETEDGVAAERFVDHANDVLVMDETSKLGFNPTEATKEVAERVVEGLDKLLHSDPTDSIHVGSSRDVRNQGKSGWGTVATAEAMRTIGALGERRSSDRLADARAVEAGDVLTRLRKRLMGGDSEATATISLGLFDAGIEAKGHRFGDAITFEYYVKRLLPENSSQN